jgi:hypothetical protein
MNEKSILEQALLQVQTLEEAVKQNAKGILASTMKQELNDLLKESMEEEEEVDEQPTPEEEESDDMSDEGTVSADAENMDNLDNEEPMKGIEGLDSESEEEENSLEDEDEDEDENAMDMTGASDEEVLKVFKAMKPEDGIIVKKDEDSIEFSDGEDDYIIKLDDETEVAENEMYEDETEDETEDEMYEDETEDETEDEVIYEIELDEEEDEMEVSEEELSEEEEEESPEEEMDEAARTLANDVRVPANQGKKYKAGRHEMNEEVEKLKKQNGEYKKALVLFKEKLNEVAVFNASLAYSTRLFTEHSTTKQEKINILKRFDSVKDMNESKSLFNTIKSELESKKSVTESVVEKISNNPTTSSSKEMLAESKAYENPQFKRMKDLMSKMK